MAATTGVSGRVVIPLSTGGGQIGLIKRFTLDIQSDIIDSTTFDSLSSGIPSNARSKRRGMAHAVGTAEAWFNAGTVPRINIMKGLNAVPTTADFELYLSDDLGGTPSQKGYKFKGMMSAITVNVQKTGQAVVTMNFESSGTITAVDS